MQYDLSPTFLHPKYLNEFSRIPGYTLMKKHNIVPFR